MSDLLTESELATRFGVSLKVLQNWRRAHSWPHVRIGRKIWFTSGQYEEIKRIQTQRSEAAPLSAAIPGQTARSASRRRSA